MLGSAESRGYPTTTNITSVARRPHFLQLLFKLKDFKLRHALLTLLKLFKKEMFRDLGRLCAQRDLKGSGREACHSIFGTGLCHVDRVRCLGATTHLIPI